MERSMSQTGSSDPALAHLSIRTFTVTKHLPLSLFDVTEFTLAIRQGADSYTGYRGYIYIGYFNSEKEVSYAM
jgi:hypothetical protein